MPDIGKNKTTFAPFLCTEQLSESCSMQDELASVRWAAKSAAIEK